MPNMRKSFVKILIVALSMSSIANANTGNKEGADSQELALWNIFKQPAADRAPQNLPQSEPESQSKEAVYCPPEPVYYASEPACLPEPVCCPPERISCPKTICTYEKQCVYAPSRCNNLWVGVDLLVWRACEDGFSCDFGDVAITNTATTTTSSTTFDQKDTDINFKWDPGVRVIVGYEFYPTNSDFAFYWTHFKQDISTRNSDNRSEWEFSYNTIDGLFGHRFWMDCCVAVRPFAGLRYAQIKQSFDTNLHTLYVTATSTTSITTINQAHQKFWGLGPQFGVEAEWYFRCGFSLYGMFDGGLLYGHFKTRHEDRDSSAVAATICHAVGHNCTCQLELDLGLGIRWESEYITLQAGLEHHRYSDFNQLGCGGNLNLFGANFGIGFHY